MSDQVERPDSATLAEARSHAERELTAAEFKAFLESETTDEALAEKRSLVEWFTRRYPTPADRSAYARRYGDAVRRARRAIEER